MQLIKISSKQEVDQFIITDSSDLQDAMFAIEQWANERRTSLITRDRMRITAPLMFSVLGECDFSGYGTNELIDFKAEVISFRNYISADCTLNS